MNQNIQNAINAALENNWEEAIKINKLILHSENENDLDSLSRIAFAHTQMGEIDKAIKVYRKILSLDAYHFIARKNLDKLKSFSNKKVFLKTDSQSIPKDLFIEEAGKTKTVNLINPSPASITSGLNIGQEVILCTKKNTIEVRNQQKEFIGALPDDVSFRLKGYLKFGNSYQVFIKNVVKNTVTVFIREISKSKKLRNHPSFFLCPEFNSLKKAAPKSKSKKNKTQRDQGSDCEPDSDE